MHLLRVRSRALGIHQGGAPTKLCCGAVCGGGVWKGTMPLAELWASFQSLPLLHTSKLGPSGADSWVGGFVYILGPCGSLQRTLLWSWEFLLLPQPPEIFTARGFEALFPWAGTLGCEVCLAPHLFLLVYLRANMAPPACQLPPCLPWSPATALPSVLSTLTARLPLLPVWMNVSSLTPWLLDFRTVQFSSSSSYFLFLNLLSFWLCKETKCIYLFLHLGWKY